VQSNIGKWICHMLIWNDMDVDQYLICFRKLDVHMARNGISLSHIIVKRRIYMEVLGPFDPISSHFTTGHKVVIHPFPLPAARQPCVSTQRPAGSLIKVQLGPKEQAKVTVPA
jgi:hypothetical protein